MRDKLIKALLAHAQGDIQKHLANVEVYLSNPAGIGEHSDIVASMDKEIAEIGKYDDRLSMVIKYLERRQDNATKAEEQKKESKSK